MSENRQKDHQKSKLNKQCSKFTSKTLIWSQYLTANFEQCSATSYV